MSQTPVVELIGNPRAGSRTRTVADAAVRALRGRLPLDPPRVLELAEVVGVSFGPEPVRGGAGDPFGTVRSAGLLVVATPTYKATYTGLLKVFLDQLEGGALAGVVAVPVAVAAAPHHLEPVATALTALLLELGASVPAPALTVLESRLAELDRTVAQWADGAAEPVARALAGRCTGRTTAPDPTARAGAHP